jgi:polysaccharide chain length determinant protein (PEP-CTERM system associated)
MTQPIQQAVASARGMWRYRWQAIGAAWAIVLLGWVAVPLIAVPNYTARAEIYIDTETVLRPLLEGLALQIDPSEQLGLMARQLMSRPNLEHVVQHTRRDHASTVSQSPPITPETLRNNISLEAERTNKEADYTNFYVLSYTNRDPALATQVVQSLIDAFAENTLAELRQDANRAKNFLEQQIKEYQKRLTASENRLRKFEREHVDTLPQHGQSYFQTLQKQQAAREAVELEIRQAESRRNELQMQLATTSPAVRARSPDGTPMPTLRESRLKELHTKLDELLLQYTEAHPDVIQTRSMIAALEHEHGTLNDAVPTVVNRIYQQLELKLKEMDGELAALRTKRQAFERRLQALQQQIQVLPMVESELKRVTRDYETNKKNYQELVARHQSMEMSESVDQSSEDLKFRVIEPPNVPRDSVLAATWKKRFQGTTTVLLAGLGIALGLAYALSTIRPTVYSQHVLSELTGLPVYGVISRVQTPSIRAHTRLDLAALVAATLTLFLTYGVALVVQYHTTYESTARLWEELPATWLTSDEQH